MMRGGAWPAVLACVAIVFSGCLSGTSEDPGPMPQADPAADPPEDLWPDCACWEPTVAVGPDGTAYATNGFGRGIVVKPTTGEARIVEVPRHVVQPLLGALPGDSMVQTDAEGRLYYHTLLYHFEDNAAYRAFMLLGIQVAVSEDGGRTWPVNTYLALPESPMLPQVGADRQWMAIAPDGTLYLVYQRVPALLGASVLGQPITAQYMVSDAALMFSRSDDGGATWSDFRAIADPDLGLIDGQPQVAADGTLLVPYFAYGTGEGLYLAVSADRGTTFTKSLVYQHPEGPGSWFPSLALGADGTIAMAWIAGNASLFVAQSPDGGATWTAPVSWHDGDGNHSASPWAFARGDHLGVLWYRAEGDGTTSLWLSEAPADPLGVPVHRVLDPLVRGSAVKPAMTDFAHGVLDAEDVLHVVWSDVEEPALWHLMAR